MAEKSVRRSCDCANVTYSNASGVLVPDLEHTLALMKRMSGRERERARTLGGRLAHASCETERLTEGRESGASNGGNSVERVV